ncbi:MAG: NAD(P)-binding protein [Oceanicaulis sp.]|nr:NAD(P)-binding protein [Oceanicaulis sp.]
MRPDADLIVIGAGVAGLMLAERLAGLGRRQLRVMLLEQGREISASRRVWSGYETRPGPLPVETGWRRIALSAGRVPMELGLGRGRYALVRGETLTARALPVIAASPALSLHTGLAVEGISRRDGLFYVETADGVLSARQVIDTRPGGAQLLNAAPFIQTSVRAEIRTGSGVFDPAVAVLVDDLRRDGRALEFSTVLPLAEDHAIVEAVRIARQGDEARPDLDRVLERLVPGGGFDAVMRTRAASPMGLSDHWPGQSSGVAMAASRGAGTAIVRAAGRDAWRAAYWAGEAAAALQDGRPVPGLPAQSWMAHSASLWALERVFARPARLLHLAAKRPPEALVRLLGGMSGAGEAVAALWAALTLPRR